MKTERSINQMFYDAYSADQGRSEKEIRTFLTHAAMDVMILVQRVRHWVEVSKDQEKIIKIKDDQINAQTARIKSLNKKLEELGHGDDNVGHGDKDNADAEGEIRGDLQGVEGGLQIVPGAGVESHPDDEVGGQD